ncbi:DUF4350 domain-containing protein [Streptosporangium sp. NPDC004379]|uniref:DUF4350 domain-containing protein n=1 Tax=Streptosporangium sp. NPDC004379 TaxID=3366189 RepID=UPI003684D541
MNDPTGTTGTTGTMDTAGAADARAADPADVGLAAAPVTGSTSVSPTAASLWRGGRGVLLVALIVVAAAVAGVLLGGTGGPDRRLDPDDTSLSGAGALARLLEGRGVRIARVTSAADARAAATAGSTLLVTDAFPLTAADASRLAGAPADLLLVGAGRRLRTLAPGLLATGEARPRSREPRCALPAAAAAGSAHLGGTTFSVPRGGTGCYPAGDDPTLVAYRDGDRTITAVGDGDFMTNLRLAEDGNAALAMNLAGARPTLVWLVPPPPGEAPAASGEQGLYDLVPPGVRWAAAQLALAVVLLALWRGRRLGPVVAERLPVVVRAAETAEGRARLYRARRARDRAAAALREGFADRVVPRLGLPSAAGPDARVSALAGRTGQPAPQVASALYGPPPADDAGLVALAAYLDMLERQVRDS